MSEKVGKVKSFVFTKEWVNPQQQTLYVHTIEFENGDKGSCWCKTKEPTAYAAGAELGYEIPGSDKIKINRVIVQQTTQTPNQYTKMSDSRKVDSIGLAFAHAKDLIVAKIDLQKFAAQNNKTVKVVGAKKPGQAKPESEDILLMDPVSDLCNAAEIIYNKMKELRQAELNENDAPPVS